jgi:hypothetical protein
MVPDEAAQIEVMRLIDPGANQMAQESDPKWQA